MIPQEKIEAVHRGLREAFGTTELENVRDLTKGAGSDLVFRIVAKGSPCVLRIITQVNEQTDPARQYACMRPAAEAGLAPCLRYASVDDGISISDYVESVPFPISEALVQIPRILRQLHALPPFPKTFNYVTTHNGFIWRFRTANLVSKDEVEEVFAKYEQLCAVYPRLDADMVSCNGNLKPETILFDGQRVLLDNWQAAFVNDRYFDLAIVANFVIASDADENKYLEEYFGRLSDNYERARFFLMRQVMHMFFATIFLLLASAGKPIEYGEKLPSFSDFHRRFWEGEVNLADSKERIVCGRVHWQQLLENVRQPRFEDSLKILMARHPSSESIPNLLPPAP